MVYKAAGLVPLFIYALSDSAVYIEKYLLREGIYPFFLAMIAFFFIRLVTSLLAQKKIQVYIFANLFIVTNYLIFVFQSRWGGTILFNLFLYVLMLIYIFRAKIWAAEKMLKKILLLIVLPFMCMFIFIYTPENFLKTGGNTSGSFLSPHLFFGHADIITLELEKDINDPEFTKFDKEVLRGINGYIKDIMANGDHSGFPVLGFNPDLFTYYAPNTYLHRNMDRKTYVGFCRSYYIRAIVNHPVLYTRKVLRQLGLFYNLKGGMYPGRMQSNDVHLYRGTLRFLSTEVKNCFPYNKYYSMVKAIVNSTGDRAKISFSIIHFLIYFLGLTYIPVLLVFCGLLGYVLIKRKDELLKKLIIPGLCIFYLFFCNFCISFSNAVIFILESRRYLEDQFLLVLLSQTLGIVFCLLVIQAIIKSRKEHKKAGS